jgi:hypothetical protein
MTNACSAPAAPVNVHGLALTFLISDPGRDFPELKCSCPETGVLGLWAIDEQLPPAAHGGLGGLAVPSLTKLPSDCFPSHTGERQLFQGVLGPFSSLCGLPASVQTSHETSLLPATPPPTQHNAWAKTWFINTHLSSGQPSPGLVLPPAAFTSHSFHLPLLPSPLDLNTPTAWSI